MVSSSKHGAVRREGKHFFVSIKDCVVERTTLVVLRRMEAACWHVRDAVCPIHDHGGKAAAGTSAAIRAAGRKCRRRERAKQSPSGMASRSIRLTTLDLPHHCNLPTALFAILAHAVARPTLFLHVANDRRGFRHDVVDEKKFRR